MKYIFAVIILLMLSLNMNAQHYTKGDYCGNVKALALHRGIKFTSEHQELLEQALIMDFKGKDFILTPSCTIGILYNAEGKRIESFTDEMKKDVLTLVMNTWGNSNYYHKFLDSYNQLYLFNELSKNEAKKKAQAKETKEMYKIYNKVLRNATAEDIVEVHENYLIVKSEENYKFKILKKDWNNPAYRKSKDMVP